MGILCLSALALSVSCGPKKKVNNGPSPEEYLYEQVPKVIDGVVYNVYADPVKEKCRVELRPTVEKPTPSQDYKRFLQLRCELLLYYKK